MAVFTAEPAMPSSIRKCFDRHSSLSSRVSTSASASPMSGHRCWADISDGEDEPLSDWGEERMLPETMLSTPESVTPRCCRTTPQETEDTLAEHQATTTTSTLNAFATEFLPTLSMPCPIVGVCGVIVEGDETQDLPSSELRFIPSHSLVPIEAGAEKSRRQCKPAALEVRQRVPRVLQGVPAETLSEEQVERRMRTIEVVKDTKEYRFHLEQVKLWGPGVEPLTPDPRDSTISKRRWVRTVQDWREELGRRYLLETDGALGENRPEAASVASTEAEEAQGSEAGDSTTDDSSSAQWSSR